MLSYTTIPESQNISVFTHDEIRVTPWRYLEVVIFWLILFTLLVFALWRVYILIRRYTRKHSIRNSRSVNDDQ